MSMDTVLFSQQLVATDDSYAIIQNALKIIRAFELRGMRALKEELVMRGSDVSDINVLDGDQQFYTMDFTWGPLNGQIVCYRVDLHRPRYDVYIAGKKTLENVNFCVQSKHFLEEEAERRMVSEIMVHLADEREKYIPTVKSAMKVCN